NLDGHALCGGSLGLGLDGARADGDHGDLTVGLGVDGERATEDRVHGGTVGLDVDDVDEQAGTDAGSEATRHLRTLHGRGGDDGGGAGGLDERREDVDLRGHQVVVDVFRLGGVDLDRTGGGEGVLQRVGGAGGTCDDGGGFTQHTRGGDEFGADLLERALGMLDEHEYFCHYYFSPRYVRCCRGARSDDLLADQVLSDLGAAVALVG